MKLKNGGNPSPADIFVWKTDPSPTGSRLWPYYEPYILWSRLLYQLPVILPQLVPVMAISLVFIRRRAFIRLPEYL